VRRTIARKGMLNTVFGKWTSDAPFDSEELFELE